MGEDEVKQVAIEGTEYDAVRVTDGNGIGYIELRAPGSTEPIARINYHGLDQPMDVCTYGHSLPLPAVLWLIERGRDALA